MAFFLFDTLRLPCRVFTLTSLQFRRMQVLFFSTFRATNSRSSDTKCNGPFSRSLVPFFQSESKCKTILMKMIQICMKMKLHIKSFSYERLRTQNHFETEAQENSEMAYFVASNLAQGFSCLILNFPRTRHIKELL